MADRGFTFALGKWSGSLSIVGGLLLVLAWPFSLYMPIRISWENGVLENLQVAILLAASVLAFYISRRDVPPRRYVWMGAAILFFLLMARELSWGAVFFEPVSLTAHGPTFSSSLLWYRPAVTPIVGIAALVALGLVLVGHPVALWKDCVARSCLPVVEFAGFAAAMLVSTAAENHMGMSLAWWHGDLQVVEETVETAAYVFIAAGVARVSRVVR